MILVFGKNGQVANAIFNKNPSLIFLSHKDAPFEHPHLIFKQLDKYKPKIVINASAYTGVDKAESETSLSLQVNAHTPGEIAHWCRLNNSTLIHYSTDYVFDGSGITPWVETDTPSPINWYGHTKWESEKNIISTGCQHYIFRVSWIYSPVGHNFAKTIQKLAQEKKELRIVNDQWGAPTKADDIAKTTLTLVDSLLSQNRTPNFGTYHLRYSPFMTWFDFAKIIIDESRKLGVPLTLEKLSPISSEDYPTPARRPKNSRLNTLYPNIFGSLSN